MLKFFIEIFCKDTTIGLCEIEHKKISGIFKSKYPDIMFKNNYVKSAFQNSFTIGQTVYHL